MSAKDIPTRVLAVMARDAMIESEDRFRMIELDAGEGFLVALADREVTEIVTALAERQHDPVARALTTYFTFKLERKDGGEPA